jgi:signal transduction histidine kinase
VYCRFYFVRQFSLLTVCFLLGSIAYGQNARRIDSLKNKLERVSSEDRIEVLRGLALAYAEDNNQQGLQQALVYIDMAYELSFNQWDSSKMVRTGVLKGIILNKLNRVDETIELIPSLLPLAQHRRNRSEYKMMLNSLALAYTEKGRYDESLKYHFKSLIEREADGDKAEISVSKNNIGLVYYRLKSYPEAIDYYTQCIQLKKESGYVVDLDLVYINLGLAYIDDGDFSEAKDNILKGLEVCGNECSAQIRIEAESGLGRCYYRENNLEEAEKHLIESLNIAKRIGSKRHQAINLTSLAQISIQREEYVKANEDLVQAEELARTIGYNEILIDVYRQFSKLFDQSRDYEKSSFYKGRYIQLRDSIYSDKLINNLAKVQSDYDEREHIKTIDDRNQTVALQKENIARQQQQIFFVVVIALLIVLLATALYLFNKSQQKVNRALSEAKHTIEDQNKKLLDSNKWLDRLVKDRTKELFDSNSALTKVNEELDHFIYKTSHDIRGPLATLKGMANLAMMDVKDPLALDYLKKLDNTAGKMNTILTRLLIINQINQSVINPDYVDFHALIYDILLIENKKGIPPRIKISFDIDKDIVFRSDKDLIRIILENLIDNAIKYYNDSLRIEPFVDVRIKKDGSLLILTVTDNGIGIGNANKEKIFQMFVRVSERSESGGIGLYLTKLATEKVDGKIEVTTTTEGYTEFSVVFPTDLALIIERRKEEEWRKKMQEQDENQIQKTLQGS